MLGGDGKDARDTVGVMQQTREEGEGGRGREEKSKMNGKTEWKVEEVGEEKEDKGSDGKGEGAEEE